MDELKTSLRNIIDAILSGKIDGEAELESMKKSAASALGLSSLPSNADILGSALPEERERLKMLVLKPTRTLSGVAVIAAMTSPTRCPHGICVPCPGGICNSSPQSYTGREPAAMRAAQHNYDPYDQVMARLGQLDEIGHPLDKAELIVMGGTITSRPIGYQQWFVKRCLMAMNDYPDHSVAPASGWRSFSDVAGENEHASVRNIGTTFETRPDWCKPEQITRMHLLGATKVELGVQSTRDDLLAAMKRGHSVEDVVLANESLREAGLKVGFHMMLGLPGSNPNTDLDIFKDLFCSPQFRPDYLKIYPTLVVEGTELYEMYLRSEYRPLGDDDAVELVSRVKALLPRYVRLQRVQRDIPANLIVAGVKKSNLRQLAGNRLKERGKRCNCIRCREAGLRGISGDDMEHIELKQESYEACGAKEYFLSFEGDDDSLVGFLRLRLGAIARVRELHIYGPLVPIGTRKDGWQHKGYGSRLVQTAENIAMDNGYQSIEITSGIGARGYYRRMGYDLLEPYMVKRLS
ncbi:MAG: tRNA uridine(34) 5-carboxymethylaminomethyl modification radical SAM/GNAT enzyme Elp3 [Methanotrichaceae archaeon]